MKLRLSLFLIITYSSLLSQVNTFPYSESFEQTFVTGTNSSFIDNWTGNKVGNSNRIYQGSDARTGSSSLNIIPISSFSGSLQVSLNFARINNPKISFYAYSKKNGSSSSSRPVILTFSTSVDGGESFLENVQIGDDTTFPNNNSTSYTEYNYVLPLEATNNANVIVKITASRGNGSGSAAELIMDDFLIEQQNLPLDVSAAVSTSSTSLVVTFNQDVSQASAELTANYTIDPNITVISAALSASNQVTLTTSELSNGEYGITISNLRDAATNTTQTDVSTTFSFIQALSSNEIVVLDNRTIDIQFNLLLERQSAENILNYSINSGIGNPISAQLLEDGKRIRLSLSIDLEANEYVLSVNGVRDESTLSVASDIQSIFSYLPLQIDGITSLSSTSIEINFNQPVDNTSATTISNYLLNYGIESPSQVTQDGQEAAKIIMTLERPMVNNTYAITLNNIRNEIGNAQVDMLETSIEFVTATLPRQIVINEIFADPSGSYQPDPLILPSEAGDEFVELYNASNNAIDISDFELSGGKINSFVLTSKSYVTLTKSSNSEKFSAFGDVVTVSSWNTLSNGGEQLSLKDNLGNIVDSLTYSLSWYRHEEKSNGGWSIAQINPELACSDINNWSASTSSSGGTPSTANSILDTRPDTQPPNLLEVIINSDEGLTLVFDELMDANSLLNANYSLDNQASVSSVVSNSLNARSMSLVLDRPLTSGLIYTLTVSGAIDCAGNTIDQNEFTFLFDNLPPTLDRLVFKNINTVDLIFDEPLVNNIAEDKTNYTIQQLNAHPISATLDASDNKRVRLNIPSPLTINSNYTIAYENLSDSHGNAIENNLFSFDFINQVDTIIVISNHLLDVYFKEPLDVESAETLNNFLVDNGINNPETASINTQNDRLLHLLFDNSFPENRLMVLSFEDLFDIEGNRMQLLNTAFNYDTDDPDLDTLIVLDQNSLQLRFDEQLDLTSSESINNYRIRSTNKRPTLVTLSNDKKSVVLQFEESFQPEETYRLSLTDIKDLSGNKISNNRSYEFVFDLSAPQLIELRLLSPKTISLEFSEALDSITAESITNYIVDNNIGNPISAELSRRNSKIVTLHFGSLGNNDLNHLEVSNISDLRGNTLIAPLINEFSSLEPSLGTITIRSETSIRAQFSKVITHATAEDLANYHLTTGLEIDNVLQDETDGSIVYISLKSPMIDATEYVLSCANLIDEHDNASDLSSQSFTFENFINGVQTLSPNTVLVDFKVDLSEATAENVANYIINGTASQPLSAVRNEDERNQVVLFFQQPFESDHNYSLRVQNLKDIFEDDIPSTSLDFIHDVTPPEVVAVNPIYLNEIQVVFNEPIDPTTAQILNHYSLNNQIVPIAICQPENSENAVLLTFLDHLSDDTNYSLNVNRVKDIAQNEIENSTVDFLFRAPEKPVFREIVINEVYFHTDQDAQLPSTEFIELHNRSDQSFLLTEFAITDKRDTAFLSNISLAANSQLILTSTAGEEDYSAYGNTLGVGSFPSLSNVGETIILLDRDLNMIDSISYNQSYYNDPESVGGGFSLELINPDKSCFDETNYHASEDELGGTPGRINSVFDNTADIVSPLLSSISIHSTNQLSVYFNEAMDISSVTKEKFQISERNPISSIDLVGAFGKEVIINLTEPFTKGEIHALDILGVTDCSGNIISDTTLNFSLGAVPQPDDLIFTEIMSSPASSNGLPEAEYIEVLNVSDKILSLNNTTLSDESNSTTLEAFDLNPGEYLILTSTVASSQLMNFGNTLGVNHWPSLNNSGDKISLHNPNGIEIFSIRYNNNWFRSQEKAAGGFSLEMIDTNYPCLLESNWIGSENESGGSPGEVNSVNNANPDLQGPIIINAIALDQSTIQIDFNERINSETIELENFRGSNGLGFIAATISEEENSVTLTTDTDLVENSIYTINSNNITDCSGNLIHSNNRNTNLIIAGKADPLDILVNEVLFNPNSGGVRFVEIYNQSKKYINLKNWRISGLSNQKVISEENLFMNPNTFITITNDGSILESQYPNADTQTFVEISSMPSLPSDHGAVKLADENDIQIDSFDYDEDYHSQLLSSYKGISLERLRFSAPSNSPSNWFSASSTSNNATPGYENSQSPPSTRNTGIITIDPQTFAPDMLGISNFTTINYSFETPGNIVNLKIMSADGRLIKQLAQNAVAGTKGFFRWEGTTTDDSKAPIGYYMVIFEVISPNGQVSHLLDKVAIGSRFEPQ